jgi:hypothetical protein
MPSDKDTHNILSCQKKCNRSLQNKKEEVQEMLRSKEKVKCQFLLHYVQ